jgi:hypothetical protein
VSALRTLFPGERSPLNGDGDRSSPRAGDTACPRSPSRAMAVSSVKAPLGLPALPPAAPASRIPKWTVGIAAGAGRVDMAIAWGWGELPGGAERGAPARASVATSSLHSLAASSRATRSAGHSANLSRASVPLHARARVMLRREHGLAGSFRSGRQVPQRRGAVCLKAAEKSAGAVCLKAAEKSAVWSSSLPTSCSSRLIRSCPRRAATPEASAEHAHPGRESRDTIRSAARGGWAREEGLVRCGRGAPGARAAPARRLASPAPPPRAPLPRAAESPAAGARCAPARPPQLRQSRQNSVGCARCCR